MKTLVTTLLLSITEFVAELEIKAVIYNHKGNKIPSGYNTHKLFTKIADYYSDCIKGSSKTGIRALLEARKNMLSDLERLTVSSYTIPPVQPVTTGPLTQKGKKGAITSSTIPIITKDSLEEAFVNNFPRLKLFKNLFFKLDNKQETLKFIQLVLIKVVKYAFWPLLFITIYIYIIKILSIAAIFLGTGYGYIRYRGLDVQTNDITRLAAIIRDYIINFWTKFINRSFGIELMNKDDVYQEAYDQARKDVFEETKTKALEAAREHFNNQLGIIEEKYAQKIQHIYSWIYSIDTVEALNQAKEMLAQSINVFKTEYKTSPIPYGRGPNTPGTNGGLVYREDGAFVIDPVVNKISSYINSWLPSYDTVVTTSIVTTASIAALGVLAFYLHRGGTLGGHEENVKKVYQHVAGAIAAKFLGETWIFETTLDEEGKEVRTFRLKLGSRPGIKPKDDDDGPTAENNSSNSTENNEASSSKGKGVVRDPDNSNPTDAPNSTSGSGNQYTSTVEESPCKIPGMLPETTQPENEEIENNSTHPVSDSDDSDSDNETVTPGSPKLSFCIEGSHQTNYVEGDIGHNFILGELTKSYNTVMAFMAKNDHVELEDMSPDKREEARVLSLNWKNCKQVAIDAGLIWSTCNHLKRTKDIESCSLCAEDLTQFSDPPSSGRAANEADSILAKGFKASLGIK